MNGSVKEVKKRRSLELPHVSPGDQVESTFSQIEAAGDAGWREGRNSCHPVSIAPLFFLSKRAPILFALL